MPDQTDTPKPPSAPCPVATSEARCPDCDRVLATQADSDALAGDWPKTPAIWIRKCWRNFKPNDGCPLVPTRTTSLDYHVFNNVRDIQTTAALAASAGRDGAV